MRDDLKESFECNVSKYFRDMTPVSESQTKEYRKRLVDNGYAIVEARTSKTGWLSYAPTKKLFEDVIAKYDVENSIFESIKCFAELADLNECSITACGSEFGLYCHAGNFQYDFYYDIDFEKHTTKWGFKPNRELPPYNGYKIRDLINTKLLGQEYVGRVFDTKIGSGQWTLVDRFTDDGESWLTLDDIIDYGTLDNYKRFEFFGDDDYCYLIKIEW